MTHLQNYSKIITICVGFAVGALYITFSYFQAVQSFHSRTTLLFSKTTKEIDEALTQLQDYLILTESRLLNSLANKKFIPQILALRGEYSLKDNKLPEIISLTFTPEDNTTASYSKYGKSALPGNSTQEKEGIFYLGKGVFKNRKILYDTKQKPFGMLSIIFSLETSLYRLFTEKEIQFLPAKDTNFKKQTLTFKPPNFPYAVIASKHPPSFKEFLVSSKGKIFSIFCFGLALFLAGIAGGIFIKHKLVKKYRALNQRLRDNWKTSEIECATLSQKLLASQNLLKLKDQVKKDTLLLSNTLRNRYRQMMAQAKSINMLISKLTSEEITNNKLLQEIHALSNDEMTILERLLRGYLAREVEEAIDVWECIEKVKKIFLPELIEKNVSFEVRGKIKRCIYADQLIFEIFLHNLFYTVVNRLNKDNSFKIHIKEAAEENPLEIIFYDDGYDLEAKLHEVKVCQGPPDILRLPKQNLGEFATYLGWKLDFESKKGELNSIKLSIPPRFQEAQLSSNVVNFLDFKPYAP